MGGWCPSALGGHRTCGSGQSHGGACAAPSGCSRLSSRSSRPRLGGRRTGHGQEEMYGYLPARFPSPSNRRQALRHEHPLTVGAEGPLLSAISRPPCVPSRVYSQRGVCATLLDAALTSLVLLGQGGWGHPLNQAALPPHGIHSCRIGDADR